MSPFALLAVLATSLTATAVGDTPTVVRAEPLPEWTAKFDRTSGWIGGDAAYSVPLAKGRVLWLFGDTWIGAVKNGSRAGSTMVNNTVAIQDGSGKLTFPIPRGKDGKPRSFFMPDDGRGFLWPMGGDFADGRLFLVLTAVESTGEPGPFGFRVTGQRLATVTNPADDPLKWKVGQVPIPHCEITKERSRTYGSAVLRHGGFVYLYGVDEPAKAGIGGKRLILARVPEKQVADFSAWQFLRDGRWQADPASPDALAAAVANECSVSFLPGLKQFALVYTQNGLSDRIVARFASAPEGPWSEPVLLYTCPEMKADKGLFTYAAKAHPHLAKGNELVVSYCVNAQDFWRVAKDASLYRPLFVRVELR